MTSIGRCTAVVCSAALLVLLVACAGPARRDGDTGVPPPPGTAAPGAPGERAPGRLLDPAAFAAAVAAPGTTALNVHVPDEGAIPGTDLSIPFDRITEQAALLPADRRTPLAVYCRTGPMSALAVRTLADMGYTDVVELAGGMTAWTDSGRPLVTAPGPPG